MKKDPITRIRSFCYLLLWLLPILYFILLAVLNKMGYSLRMFPKPVSYTHLMSGRTTDICTWMVQYKRLDPRQIIRMGKVNNDIHLLFKRGQIGMVGSIRNHHNPHIITLSDGIYNHFPHVSIADNKYI